MLNWRWRLAAGLGLVAGFSASWTYAEDWPNFRGPRLDGKSTETGLKYDWKDPIPLVWEQKIGPGYSSFACVGGKVYTCGQAGKQQILFCMDATTGAIQWQFPIEKEWVHMDYHGPRSTPTVHEGKVYVQGALGRLVCVRADDGKLVWEKQFTHPPQWGYSGSVLIEGNLAVTSGGKEQGAMVAFDKNSGKEVWKAGDEQAGYSTPYPFTFNGRRYIVNMSGVSVLIVEASTGKLAMRMPWETSYDVNASSPIFHDGHLFLASGYDTGCGVFKLESKGDELSAGEVWRSKVMLNKFQTCLLHEGKLYGSDQNSLACVDFMTGKEAWRIRGAKDGTLILVEGHLLFLAADGTLKIAPVSPQKFEPISNAQILAARCWTAPVLCNGRIYARDNVDRAVCFDLRGTSASP